MQLGIGHGATHDMIKAENKKNGKDPRSLAVRPRYPRFNSTTVARSNWRLSLNCKTSHFTADDAE